MTGSLDTTAADRRLTGLKDRQLASYTTTCTITVPTVTKTASGGNLGTSAVIAENVDCTVAFPSVNPTDASDRAATTAVQRAEIRVPIGTPVSVKARIVTADGRKYDVQGHDAGASFADSITCQCVRADDGH